MKIRVKFSKHGALKFIGHLDVMRYFQKANRRAEIDVTYSTGFSPHQVMSFAAPLGLGLESNGEYFDLEVNSITTAADMIEKLNSQMVDGIRILEMKCLGEKAENAMASVAAAAYHIAFREGMEPDFSYQQTIADFYAQSEIMVTKKTKKSETTFDMKPYIFELRIAEDGKSIWMVVDASSAGNIKPSLVLHAFYQYNQAVLDEFALLITREETYTNVGTAENWQLVSLGAVGEDF